MVRRCWWLEQHAAHKPTNIVFFVISSLNTHAYCRNEEAAALGFSAADGVAEGALAAHAPLAISCWRGRASVNHMVARPEAAQLAEKLRTALGKTSAAGASAVQEQSNAPMEIPDAAAA